MINTMILDAIERSRSHDVPYRDKEEIKEKTNMFKTLRDEIKKIREEEIR